MDLNHIPLVPPVPPQVSNFVDPPTLAPILIAVGVSSLAVMLPMFAVRVYVKAWIVRSIWWDDVCCTLAVVGAVSYLGLALASLKVIAHHIWDVPISHFTEGEARRQIIGFEISYGPTTFFAKASLLLLYLRLFKPNRGMRWAIWTGVLVNFLYYMAVMFVFVAWCVPRRHESWLQADTSAKCRRSYVISYAHGVFGVVSDLYIFILPMPVIWTLHLPLQKRIGIFLIFTTGFLACISSIVGLWLRVVNVKGTDATYGLGQTIIAAIAETNAGVICACAPSVAKLYRHYPVHFPSVFSFAKFRAKILKQPSSKDGFDRVGSSRPQDIRLETKILASAAQAEGRFMKPDELIVKDWQRSKGETITEAWAH